MAREHTDKTYDKELQRLEQTVLMMGRIVEDQITDAVEALLGRDNNLAISIIDRDKRVNDLEDEVDRHTIRLLSLRQPMGGDLRYITATTKIAMDLERIADYAANIAVHIPGINSVAVEKAIESIVSMTRIAQDMLKDILAAYHEPDVGTVVDVWHRDDQIDAIYPKLLNHLTDYMKSNPEVVDPCTSLIFVGRSIERIGDHITNIAEQIHYIVNGSIYRGNQKDQKSQ